MRKNLSWKCLFVCNISSQKLEPNSIACTCRRKAQIIIKNVISLSTNFNHFMQFGGESLLKTNIGRDLGFPPGQEPILSRVYFRSCGLRHTWSGSKISTYTSLSICCPKHFPWKMLLPKVSVRNFFQRPLRAADY